MSYLLRFVQRFNQRDTQDFMELERKFAALEQEVAEYPKGSRYIPFTGREPANTLIWECEFNTLEALQDAVRLLEEDLRHKELFEIQSKYFIEAFTEIYQSFKV